MSTPLHHLHIALAQGTRKRAAVSADIGPHIRIRLDGGTDAEKAAAVLRLAVLWNMHEGIPTPVLESGAVRHFYDAVQALLDVAREHPALLPAVVKTEAAWSAITIEPTKDGRRAECNCSERADGSDVHPD